MSGLFNFTTLIFLLIAVVIFLRLRSVLGTRTGNERSPFDRQSESPREQTNDNVVALPTRNAPVTPPPAEERSQIEEQINQVAKPGTALNSALSDLAAADGNFDPAGFLSGAQRAYEMIVTAFAEGDRKALKPLLNSDVYEGFVSAISARESEKQTVEFKFVGINKSEIIDAAMKQSMAQITLKFVSQLISATKDSEGRIVDGDPNDITTVTDIWTFSRDTASSDPNWKLIGTEAVD